MVEQLLLSVDGTIDHLQTHGDLLLIVNMKDMLQDEKVNQGEYYSGSIGDKVDISGSDLSYSAGMRVFNIENRANPREIGFMPLEGLGVHRIWYTGGQWAYISALPPGFSDDIFIIVDIEGQKDNRLLKSSPSTENQT